VLHLPGTTVQFDLWRRSWARVGKRHGLEDIRVRSIERQAPFPRDELQLWPPAGDLGTIDRREPTERDRREREEELEREREDHQRTRLAFRRLSQEVADAKRLDERVREGGVIAAISGIAGLAGGLPDYEEWNELDRLVFKAQSMLDRHDYSSARGWIKRADANRRAIQRRLERFQADTIKGAGRMVWLLGKVAAVGEVAANLLPGPLGKIFSLGYEVVKPAPKTLEEAAERMRGAYQAGGGGGGGGGGVGGGGGGRRPGGGGGAGGVPRRRPGLPTPDEDVIIRQYTRLLADLRASRGRVEQLEGVKGKIDPRWLDEARARYKQADDNLQMIEDAAKTRTPSTSELEIHLAPLKAERTKLKEQGLIATLSGRRIEACCSHSGRR
jgi:hypothetical protein